MKTHSTLNLGCPKNFALILECANIWPIGHLTHCVVWHQNYVNVHEIVWSNVYPCFTHIIPKLQKYHQYFVGKITLWENVSHNHTVY